jgi:hypothetical protein
MLFAKITGIYCENLMRHIRTLRGQHSELPNVTVGGDTCDYQHGHA